MMTTEEVTIKENVERFVSKLQDAFVDKIVLSLDVQPAFDKAAVPFQFDYSFFAIIITDKGNFKIISAATSEGMETFWIEQVEEIAAGNKVMDIRSSITSIELGVAKDYQYPFKMSILCQDKEILLYCGEIYANVDGTLKFTFNDEMIFVFEERQEAVKFEKLINYQ